MSSHLTGTSSRGRASKSTDECVAEWTAYRPSKSCQSRLPRSCVTQGAVDLTDVTFACVGPASRSPRTSPIKLRWMIDNWEHFRKVYEADDLAFGTIEFWIAYVGLQPHLLSLALVDGLRQNLFGVLSASQHISEVTNASRTPLLSVRTLNERGVRNISHMGLSKVFHLGGLVGDRQEALIGQ